MALLVDEETVEAILGPEQALAAVEQSFRLLAASQAVNEPRHRTAFDGATLNVMWAHAPTLDAVGVKSYPVVRSDVSQAASILLTLCSHSTGECLAIVQADLLGARRTAAVTALATRLAARPESEVLALFGTGYQAGAQVEALAAAVPSLCDVRVVGRDPARRDRFLAAIAARLPHVRFMPSEAEAAVRSADVVVTATGSSDPVFEGTWLRPGTHVNAVGSNQRINREVDRVTLTQAARILVDSREVTALECGDLLVNGIDPAETVELADVVVGRVPGRCDDDEVTVLESHGLALHDLLCGMFVVQTLTEQGRGSYVDFPRKPLSVLDAIRVGTAPPGSSTAG